MIKSSHLICVLDDCTCLGPARFQVTPMQLDMVTHIAIWSRIDVLHTFVTGHLRMHQWRIWSKTRQTSDVAGNALYLTFTFPAALSAASRLLATTTPPAVPHKAHGRWPAMSDL